MLSPNTFLTQWQTFQIPQGTPLYLGISGGGDSMALLDLLLKVAKEYPLTLLHVNYGLRKEAEMETDFLREYAKVQGLPLKIKYFPADSIFSENTARDFRYDFFKGEMKEQGILLTGHHGNDLIETLLMKLTRGTNLKKLAFDKKQPFGKGQLIRPLLSFSKQEIYQYLHYHQVPYFEDASNNDLVYERNRFRHEIIPLLEKENPKLQGAFYRFNESLLPLKEPYQTKEKIIAPIKSSLPESCEDNEVSYSLFKNTWVKISATESFGFFDSQTDPKLPLTGKFEILPLYEEVSDSLIIRHPKSGDRILLKEKNYTKKVTRYFIDEKIPEKERKNQWLVTDKFKNVLWIVPKGKSYLSLPRETDKMFYRLIHYQKL